MMHFSRFLTCHIFNLDFFFKNLKQQNQSLDFCVSYVSFPAKKYCQIVEFSCPENHPFLPFLTDCWEPLNACIFLLSANYCFYPPYFKTIQFKTGFCWVYIFQLIESHLKDYLYLYSLAQIGHLCMRILKTIQDRETIKWGKFKTIKRIGNGITKR